MSLPPPTDNYIGEPQYPSPWTTKKPREGLRDTDAARIVSLAPDVCKSPGCPVPYPVVDFCGHDENYTPSVRFTSQKAMVLRSNTTHVHGDEPGVGKGVKSGTVGARCHPIGHADEVRAEGSCVIRHLDRFHMNDRNTVGEACFVRDTKTYKAPVDDDKVPGSLRRTMTDWEEPVILNAQYAEAAPAILPNQNPSPAPAAPSPKPPGQLIRPDVPHWKGPPILPKTRPPSVLKRLGKFGTKVGILAILTMESPGEDVIMSKSMAKTALAGINPQDAYEQALYDQAHAWLTEYKLSEYPSLIPPNFGTALSKYDDVVRKSLEDQIAEYRRQKKQEEEQQPVAAPLPQSESVRIAEREKYRKKCEVDRYGKMRGICGKYGMQAHHIVPDWTLRYGARNDSSKRIPNMPSLNDGMAICVIGNAAMQDTEHNEAHLGDSAIEAAGAKSSPPGTATLAKVRNESLLAMIKARPDCVKEIAAALGKQFGSKNPSQLLRAIKDINQNPLHPDTIRALSTGAAHP
jgi:Domain of unknown function (DUF4150)